MTEYIIYMAMTRGGQNRFDHDRGNLPRIIMCIFFGDPLVCATCN